MAMTVEQAKKIHMITAMMKLFSNSRIDDGSTELLNEVVASLSLAEVKAAVLKLTRTSHYAPTVADVFDAAQELRDEASGITRLTGGEAWQKVLEEVRSKGRGEKWVITEATARAVEQMGGKYFLCMMEESKLDSARRDFIRLYDAETTKSRNKQANRAVLKQLGGKELLLGAGNGAI